MALNILVEQFSIWSLKLFEKNIAYRSEPMSFLKLGNGLLDSL